MNRSGYSVLEPLRVLSDAVHRVVHSVCAPGLRVGHRNALLRTLNRSFGLVAREAEQLEVGDVAVAGITGAMCTWTIAVVLAGRLGAIRPPCVPTMMPAFATISVTTRACHLNYPGRLTESIGCC